ncbi:hypothetical protein [Stappia sp.]|uniref:hypothetical protein n=1 Tax=Stappia sp. TaxID=1870903 RepID=UPI0032D98EC7
MTRSNPRLTLALSLALPLATALLAASAPGARADDDLAERGKALSRQHCARCHVVAPDDRMTGISSTPSFMILVEALDDWRERFATFHARLPHPAHLRFEGDAERPDTQPATIAEVILRYEDVEAIVAYAERLHGE